jgi:type II secretory pathway pseudopilin PulG
MRGRRLRGEDGSPTIEMIATILILSIMLTFVYQAVGSLQNAIAGSDDRTANINEARVLMSTATKDLRTATRLQSGTSPFLIADSTEVEFYGNINTTTGPNLVHIYVDGQSRLVELVTAPDAGSVAPNYTYTGTPSTRFVGQYITNTALSPIFRYYDANGNELTPRPLSAANMLGIRQVQVSMVIRKSTVLTVAATTLQSRVWLPNLDYRVITG